MPTYNYSYEPLNKAKVDSSCINTGDLSPITSVSYANNHTVSVVSSTALTTNQKDRLDSEMDRRGYIYLSTT